MDVLRWLTPPPDRAGGRVVATVAEATGEPSPTAGVTDVPWDTAMRPLLRERLLAIGARYNALAPDQQRAIPSARFIACGQAVDAAYLAQDYPALCMALVDWLALVEYGV